MILSEANRLIERDKFSARKEKGLATGYCADHHQIANNNLTVNQVLPGLIQVTQQPSLRILI